MLNNNIAEIIDARVKARGGEPGHEDTVPRGHLGASVIGKKCYRQTYYGWRWALPKNFEGRMLRLFATGFKYEHRFIALLSLLGITVAETDYDNSHSLWYHEGSDSYFVLPPHEQPNINSALDICDDVTSFDWHILRAAKQGVKLPKLKQFGFKDETGHFSGSCDGIATGVPGIEKFGLSMADEILVEFKTHGEKSFTHLKEYGVKVAKPEHYGQMTTYMQERGLKLALYCAVNKNTDELYFEFVVPDPENAAEMKGRAHFIIGSRKIPQRISNSPSFFECQYCDYRQICHFAKPMQMNCRTCRHSEPVANGAWKCNVWHGKIIPFQAQLEGCPKHQPVTD